MPIRSSTPPALFVALASLAALATGCASTPASGPAAASEPAYEEGAVVHHVSAADRQRTLSQDPLAADRAVLWVNGLGCPQCASNVDIQLLRLKAISQVHVDLSTGKVAIVMDKPGLAKPSPAQLAHAVEDAGFTLAKIETP